MSFFEELGRRNVVRVGILYIVASWLVLQVVDVLSSLLPVPGWTGSLVFLLLVAGLLPVLIFSWVYELTPEGIKREREVDRSRSITHETGRKIDILTVVLLVLAIGVVVLDRLIPERIGPKPTEVVDESADVPALESSALAAQKFAPVPDQSIAVLPFVNMSGDEENEYFADGLSEEILNFLAGIPDLQVTARTSSFQFKGENQDVREVGEALNVAHVLEGSVRRSGDRARISVQLVRTSNGYQLWSESYDRKLEDVFEVQTDIAERVSRALGLVIDETQRQKMREEGVADVEAFIAYQKGRARMFAAHEEDVDMTIMAEAGTWLTEAIRREPRFASAYFLRSDLYAHRTSMDGMSDQDRQAAYESYLGDLAAASEFARSTAERAVIDVDRTLASPNWGPLPERIDAALSAEKCVESLWLNVVPPFGYEQKSLDFWVRQLRCNPLRASGYYEVSWAAIWSGQPELALETALRGLELEPDDPGLLHLRVRALLILNRIEEAGTRAESTDQSIRDRLIAYTAAAAGDAVRAEQALERVLEKSKGWTRKKHELELNAMLGNREVANAAAAWFDRIPMGQLMLATSVVDCACGAPFDLEAAPVFAERLQEAGFPWPPADIMKFPTMRP
jgi:TolB-like protein